MQLLSSAGSPFTKFVLPAGFLCGLPVWIISRDVPGFGWTPAILWATACALLIWWTVPIKKVILAGETFQISNYVRTITVPISSLVRIDGQPMNRTPSIVLYFDPRTEFGKKVRIVVPWRQYDQIERTLCEIVGQDGASASRRAARLVEEALSEGILRSEESQGLSRLSALARSASSSAAGGDSSVALRREEKTPNKAPEPTPGAVTPRATEGDSK